jgi:site-specific DNA-methyltransferase (adenine-specific)
MRTEAHFSSKSGEYATPQGLFDRLDKEFHFTLDPCATAKNTKCKQYYSKGDNSLAQKWAPHTVFMNPPYGSQIGRWMRKAYTTAQSSPSAVVCLIPARTDTRWWHDYCMKADEIRFIKGRIRFGGQKNSAPFPSAIVIFRDKLDPRTNGAQPRCTTFVL